jgi:hypothetical protein
MIGAASAFHAGEQTIQSLAGVRERIERRGHAVIRDHLPEQHRAFFAALPFMVVGLADQNGHPWATTLVDRIPCAALAPAIRGYHSDGNGERRGNAFVALPRPPARRWRVPTANSGEVPIRICSAEPLATSRARVPSWESQTAQSVPMIHSPIRRGWRGGGGPRMSARPVDRLVMYRLSVWLYYAGGSRSAPDTRGD